MAGFCSAAELRTQLEAIGRDGDDYSSSHAWRVPLLYFVCLSHAWGVLHNGPERTSVPLSVARPPERSPRLFRAASP